MSDGSKGVTIVTGGSRGIGAATALLCGQNGHAVCVTYRDRADKAEEVVASIKASGGEAIAVQADTAVEADVTRLFEMVDDALGTVTGLVNNAGIHGPRIRVDALETTDVERVLAVNVTALFQCSREAIRRMSTRHGGKGGAIVNVSSGSARLGSPGAGVLYAASKGAVNSLTIGLSQEVAGEGIRVNAVAPGLTVTDMPPAERLERDGPNLPIGRAAQPEEIAEAIYWLLTDNASYVAGANLRVGGGRI
ncbi:MAG: SDR family oxidoreductase [Boseongicola sp.]|nr:SDR family oxidoreductase [Boseongicola sp.]MDD9976222.1 SDR family oxidoreductase [Boseongicola sp.]